MTDLFAGVSLDELVADVGTPEVDSDRRTLELGCDCVSQHNPDPVFLVKHHVLPKSWGGGDELGNIA